MTTESLVASGDSEDMAITPYDGDQTLFLEFGAGIVDDPVDCA